MSLHRRHRLPCLLASLVLAAGPALAAPAAAPEESVVAPELIRIEGVETTAGLLCCPRFLKADHALVVTPAGALHHTILVRGGGEAAEQEPAAATFVVGQLRPAELRKLLRLLAEAKIGQQRECTALGSFVFYESSAFGRRRVTWTGPTGRRRSFETWRGDPCSDEVKVLIAYLRNLAASAALARD